MAKIRKNAKRKTYQFNKNRKRMNKKTLPKTSCSIINKNLNKKLTTEKNMSRMGLVFNVNSDIVSNKTVPKKLKTTTVVETLEKDANALREKGYRLPKNQVEFLTYMLDKYGEDYKSMVRDKRNQAQLTWKQFRKKINTFKSIPEQFNLFLESRKGKEEIPMSTNVDFDDDD